MQMVASVVGVGTLRQDRNVFGEYWVLTLFTQAGTAEADLVSVYSFNRKRRSWLGHGFLSRLCGDELTGALTGNGVTGLCDVIPTVRGNARNDENS